MNRNKEVNARRHYVEDILCRAMQPKKGFESIRYATDSVKEQEYIKISDVRGSAVFINITGNSLEDILADVCKIMLIGILGKHDKMTLPAGIITDGEQLLKIAALFKERGLKDV